MRHVYFSNNTSSTRITHWCKACDIRRLTANSRNRYENIQHHTGTWCKLTAHALHQPASSTKHALAQARCQHSTGSFAFRIDPSAVMRPGGQSWHGPQRGNSTKAFTTYSIRCFKMKKLLLNGKFQVWLRNIYFDPESSMCVCYITIYINFYAYSQDSNNRLLFSSYLSANCVSLKIVGSSVCPHGVTRLPLNGFSWN